MNFLSRYLDRFKVWWGKNYVPLNFGKGDPFGFGMDLQQHRANQWITEHWDEIKQSEVRKISDELDDDIRQSLATEVSDELP